MTHVNTHRGMLLCLFGWVLLICEPVWSGTASDLQQVQALFEKKDYQKALEEFGKLNKEISDSQEAYRLKIRILLRVGNPKDALVEYDKLVGDLKHDDQAVLREVALGFILVLTKDMREQMRGVAYTALKEWRHPEAIPVLEDGLNDGSGLVRALAAEGLAKLDAGRRSDRFRQALDDQAALVKEAVLKGLAQSGDASILTLVEPALKDPEVRVRLAAAEVLCNLKRQKGCDLLTRSVKALNPDERAYAVRVLADRQGTHALSMLIDASNHTQPSVRGAAATGLAHIDSGDAATVLTRLLKDPLTPVRIAAAVSLGQLHNIDTVTPLRNALEDRDAAVRAFVVGALLGQGESYGSVAATVQTLSNTKEPAIRAAVARALGHATQPNREQAQSTLLMLYQDTVPRVRIAAIKSIAKISGLSAVPILKQALHDEDDAVRATAGGGILQLMVQAASSQR